ncbi:hypothetical protein V6N11_058452 [Hibiscus sabdariffa]|uniref:Uncharacterized protein n=1 Tax=Hibiscus sabdariffa TaxID=183260 RepID=A0ABR2U4A6_9ROSI
MCTKLPEGMPPKSKVDRASNFHEEGLMQEVLPKRLTTNGQSGWYIELRGIRSVGLHKVVGGMPSSSKVDEKPNFKGVETPM